jgi:archaellum component FlaC
MESTMTDAEVRDITVEILRSIRDEVAGLRLETREGLGQVNRRLDETNSRLDETNSRLGHLESRFDNLQACERGIEELRRALDR